MARILQSAWVASLLLQLVVHGASVTGASGVPEQRLKLKTFVVPSVAGGAGLLVTARVNDGPPLRLLLDSGAQYLVLDHRAAIRSGCSKGGATLDLIGPGNAPPSTVRMMKTNSVEIGGFTRMGVEAIIVAGHLVDGIDGVAPLTLFNQFLVRLDLRGKNLDLIPYEPGHAALGSEAIASNGLLFVKGTLNGKHEGHFLLDTGAMYNAISTDFARRIHSTFALSQPVAVQGGALQMFAHPVSDVLLLEIGARTMKVDPVVAIDLSTSTRYHGLAIAGLLGYPALRDSVVTVNYRDSRVQIDHK